MATDPRIDRTKEQLVHALDAHLFTLRSHLQELHNSSSHLKVISAELRVLVCRSSKVEGLLWRLTSALSIDDGVYLNLAGDLDTSNPLTKDLSFLVAPMSRGSSPHPHFQPHVFPLMRVIKETQALIAMGKPLTHEALISAVAQQMGSAHEADKVDPTIAQLSSIFLNGVEPYVGVLAFDAQLVLEVGERVLTHAEQRLNFQRQLHGHDYGNVSIFLRLRVKRLPKQEVCVFKLHSYAALATIEFHLNPLGTELVFLKQGVVVNKINESFDCPPEEFDLIESFSYCSRVQQSRRFFSDSKQDTESLKPFACPLGWVHAADLEIQQGQSDDSFGVEYLLVFSRLLSSKEATQLTEPNAGGVFISQDEARERGPFPD